MPVEQFKHESILRLETAMREHEAADERRFSAVEGQQARMAGSLDVIADNQQALMSAFGVRHDQDERAHKPVALMGQREWFVKILGAMGGLLVLEKVLVVSFPFVVQAMRAIAGIH